jgi:O-antigen ligase
MNRRALTSEDRWRGAIAILLMTSLIAPLIIGYDFFFPFVVPRNIFFRVVIEIAAVGLILFALFEKKRIVLRGEWIFWCLAVFLGTVTLSAVFSPARNHSFFGDFERMGGVWAWLHFTLFFLLLRTLRDEDWTRLLSVAVVVSALVSVNAVIERLTAPRAIVAGVQTVAGTASTVGNSGLLAAYLLFGVGICCYLALTQKRFALLYALAGVVDLVALILAQNRSSLIGLVLGAIAGGVLFASLSAASRRRWLVPSIAVAAALILTTLVVAVRRFPGSALLSPVPNVVSRLASTNPAGADGSRTMQWGAAIRGFRDRPLLGYGPENYNLVWSRHFDARIYALDTDIYDHAHNQYLELLATVGIVGTCAFLAIWGAIAYALVVAYRKRNISAGAVSILAGLQVAYATYLTFWFVDLNSTMLWIAVAALAATLANPVTMVRPVGVRQREWRWVPWAGATATAAVLIILVDQGTYRPLRASHALAVLDGSMQPVSSVLPVFDDAMSVRSGPTSHTAFVLAGYLGNLSPSFAGIRFDRDESRATDVAFQKAIEAFREEIHRDTLNDRLYTHLARLLVDASHFYRSDSLRRASITELQRAIELSPHRIQQRTTLAAVYLEEQDTLRAQRVLEDAIHVDPALGEPRFQLARIYLGRNRTDSAAVSMRKSLALGYVGPPEPYLAIGKRLEFAGRAPDAAGLYSDYLEAKYTKAVWEQSGSIDKSIPAADIAVAAHLPLLYARAQESELAIKSAAALALFDPAQSPVVDRFVSDVGGRHRRSWLAKNTLLQCEAQRSRIARDSVAVGACAVFRRKL